MDEAKSEAIKFIDLPYQVPPPTHVEHRLSTRSALCSGQNIHLFKVACWRFIFPREIYSSLRAFGARAR
jgi:hypothetical protein